MIGSIVALGLVSRMLTPGPWPLSGWSRGPRRPRWSPPAASAGPFVQSVSAMRHEVAQPELVEGELLHRLGRGGLDVVLVGPGVRPADPRAQELAGG
jgi:hypothetical protein